MGVGGSTGPQNSVRVSGNLIGQLRVEQLQVEGNSYDRQRFEQSRSYRIWKQDHEQEISDRLEETNAFNRHRLEGLHTDQNNSVTMLLLRAQQDRSDNEAVVNQLGQLMEHAEEDAYEQGRQAYQTEFGKDQSVFMAEQRERKRLAAGTKMRRVLSSLDEDQVVQNGDKYEAQLRKTADMAGFEQLQQCLQENANDLFRCRRVVERASQTG